MKLVLLLFAVSLSCVCSAGAVETDSPSQSQASFEAAIRNLSTAPSYVSIAVIDARSGTTRSTCTTANLLLGAIHREYGFAFDRVGTSSTEQVALSNLTHTFRFAQPQALANIQFNFSDADLASIREKLQNFTVPELREGFSTFGKLHSVYRVGSLERHNAYRDAAACVLIERGLSPRVGDRSDQIWIAP